MLGAHRGRCVRIGNFDARIFCARGIGMGKPCGAVVRVRKCCQKDTVWGLLERQQDAGVVGGAIFYQVANDEGLERQTLPVPL